MQCSPLLQSLYLPSQAVQQQQQQQQQQQHQQQQQQLLLEHLLSDPRLLQPPLTTNSAYLPLPNSHSMLSTLPGLTHSHR